MRSTDISTVIDVLLLLAGAALIASIARPGLLPEGMTPLMGIIALAWVVIRLIDGKWKIFPDWGRSANGSWEEETEEVRALEEPR